MDLEAEYAARYGGPPRRDQSWHQVLALVERTGRFDARDRLVAADGALLGQPVAPQESTARDTARHHLHTLAYGRDV